jgi:hypothetical protein
MTFIDFCSSVKAKFISFKNKLFKSNKKVGDSKCSNKFDNHNNNDSEMQQTLRSIMTRLESIEKHLNNLIEEKNKEIGDIFDKNSSNKRYKVL